MPNPHTFTGDPKKEGNYFSSNDTFVLFALFWTLFDVQILSVE